MFPRTHTACSLLTPPIQNNNNDNDNDNLTSPVFNTTNTNTMPSLPIALGDFSTTTEQVPGPYPHQLDDYYDVDEDTNHVDDGRSGSVTPAASSSPSPSPSPSTLLQPVDLFQTIAFGLCPEKEWQARVVFSFYDVMKHNSNYNNISRVKTTTMVEIRIRISRVCHPSLAATYRETTYHLKLPEPDTTTNIKTSTDISTTTTTTTTSNDSNEITNQKQQRPRRRRPQVVFSEDRKNLCILMFHPHYSTSSSVVICQLRRPRLDAVVVNKNRNRHRDMMPSELPTPPSYVLDVQNDSSNNNNNSNGGTTITSTISSNHDTGAVGTAAGGVSPSGGTTAAASTTTTTARRKKLVARSHNLGETPAIATNPRFITTGISWGTHVVSLCRIPITQLGTKPIFLLVCEDSTLVWVDSRSGHALARGKVPWQQRNNLKRQQPQQQQLQPIIRSIQASPDSTLSKGSLIVVTNSSSSSTNVNNEIRGGECVLLQYKVESTTPMQQNFLKRASTGTVTMIPANSHLRSSVDDLDLEASMHKSTSSGNFQKEENDDTSIDRVAPLRSVSMGTVLHRRVNNIISKQSQALQDQTSKLQKHLRNQQDQNRRRVLNGGDKTRKNINRSNSFSMLQQNRLGEMFLSASSSKRSTPSNNSSSDQQSARRKVYGRNEKRQQRRQGSSRSQSRSSSSSSLLEGISHALEGIQKMTESNANTSSSDKQKEEMKLYLLRELQSRPKTRSIVEDEQVMERLSSPISTRNLVAGDLAAFSSPTLNGIHTNGQDGENGSHQSTSSFQTRSPQNKSIPHNSRGTMTIKVDVLSTWEDHGHDSDSNPQFVVDASFGSVSSLVCILLQAEKTCRNQRVAEVCYIDGGGMFVPIVPLTLSLDHVEQSIPITRESSLLKTQNDDKIGDSTDDEVSQVGLDYDPVSESFIVNAIYGNKKHWVATVWNWRSNSLGLIIRGEFHQDHLTSLRLVRDEERGWNLVCIDATLSSFETVLKRIEVKTSVVTAGFLSPPTSGSSGGALSEGSSLLLSRDFVTIPSTKKRLSDPSSLDLTWKISAFPAAYVATFGAPMMAAVGPMKNKSIAIASTHGICVLDAHRPSSQRWKQFRPFEEKAFTVIAMTWWEGTRSSKRDIETDDLLIAIIKHRNGQQYLSCWSPKRLDVLNQLLESSDPNWKPDESQGLGPRWGVELPNDLNLTNLSLLVEPQKILASKEERPRRAVAIVYAVDGDRSEFDYICFQLQAVRRAKSASSSSDQKKSQKAYGILALEKDQGRIQNGARSVGPIQSIFVAGASFCFDLRHLSKKKLDDKTRQEEDLVATLGVIRLGGMESICLTSNGKGWLEQVTDRELSRLWLVDVVFSNQGENAEDSAVFATFVWAFELLNGCIFCWAPNSVLFVKSNGISDRPIPMHSASIEAKMEIPRGLRLPSLVCKKESNAWHMRRWLSGTLCEVGTASDWMQHSSSGSKFHMELGSVPGSPFGCTLRAGQSTKRLERGNSEPSVDIYCQSSFLMTPPAFVLSVNILLLEAASLRVIMKDTNINSAESIQGAEVTRLRYIDRHVHERLSAARNKDVVMMALRLLILRSVELVSSTSKTNNECSSDVTESNFLLAKTYFAGTVDAVRRSTTNLQYASLFLEVGRQVEPSSLEYLFPLPLPPPSSLKLSMPKSLKKGRMLDKTTARTVSDLFTICVEERSLAAAASALPLFPTKSQALHYSQMLLDEAIHSFVGNTTSRKCEFDSTEEERQVIGDIFRFAIKLEDSDVPNGTDPKSNGRGPALVSTEKSASRNSNARFTMSEGSESEDNAETRALICGSGTFLKYMVPSNIVRESEKAKEEEAIKKAASSFIKHSLDDPVIGFATLPDWDDSSKDMQLSDASNVTGVVGEAIIDLLQSRDDRNWSAMAGLADLLVHDGSIISRPDVTKIPSLSLFKKVAGKVHHLDVLSILPEGFDVNDDGESERCLALYLEEELSRFHEQLILDGSIPTQQNSASNIFELALMMLNRFEKLPSSNVSDQSLLELGLVVITMVAGYHCGHSVEILENLESECLSSKSYESAVKETR